MGCTTLIAGRETTENGYVLVAHNEDEGGRFVVYHGMLPERDWDLTDPAQAYLPAEEGHAAVPQIPHTFRCYWVENVNPERGASSSDMFLNQNGVLVTSNSAQSSKPDMNDPTLVKDGGIAYNLRRAVGERAESARHGVQIALSLLAEYGYAPGGRSYTIADKNEAWNIQAVHGHYYVAARVPDNAVMVLPNHLSIHTLTDFPVSLALDHENPVVPMEADFSEGAYLYPDDLIPNAIAHGWYTPREDGRIDDFDFAYVYQAPECWKALYNINRHARGVQLVLGKDSLDLPEDPLAELHGDADKNFYPFCVCPEETVPVERCAEILCQHFEAFPEIKTELGPGKSPHLRRGFILCYGGSTESFIAQFEDDPMRTTLWTAFGRSCHQPWIPLHPLNGIPETLEPLGDASERMRTHLEHHPERTCWRDNAWWQSFRRFQELADMQFCDIEEPLRSFRREHFARERMMNLAALSKHSDLAKFDAERVNAAAREWQWFADRYFNLVTMFPPDPISLDARPERIEVSFLMPFGQTPTEERMILCQANLHLEKDAAKLIPGTLTEIGGGAWRASFEAAPIMKGAYCAGEFDYYLGGINTEGRTFAGQLILRFE